MSNTFVMNIVVLTALNLWIAWRYSRLPLGQDEGLWMLWGFTGALPYRDAVDCKPPGIHLWLWLLARVTGKNIAATKFLHFLVIGSFAIAAYTLSGSIYAGLLFTALAQSAWLRAYHEWIEPLSSGFLMLAFLLTPWLATCALAIALLFNLKLGLPVVVLLLLHGWWVQLMALTLSGAVLLGGWVLLWPNSFREVCYGSITVAYRMTQWRERNGQRLLPVWDSYFVTPLLLVVPALAAAIVVRPDPVIWAPAVVYTVINMLGRAWRPYHWIPLVAMASVAAPPAALFVLLAEWITNALYLGDIIGRTRPQVAEFQRRARAVGEKIRHMEAPLWVNNEYTQIYIYARKRPALSGLVEQVEIRHVIAERRGKAKDEELQGAILVLGPGSPLAVPWGYRVALIDGPFTVLRPNADPQRI